MNPGPALAILAASAFIGAVCLVLVAAYGFAVVCGLIAAGAFAVWGRDYA